MHRIAFIDVHNIAPHLETAFELAQRHLDAGDSVQYHFLGHELPFREFMAYSRFEARIFRRWMPEQRAAKLVAHPNLTFVPHAALKVSDHRVQAPGTLAELKAWTYDGADLGMGVASSLISRSGNSHFDPARNAKQVEDALAGCIAVYEHCLSVLGSERPDLLYVFNGRLCHTRAILRAAEKLGIEVRVHDRGADKDLFVVRPFVPHDRDRIQQEMTASWAASGQGATKVAGNWFEERRSGQPRDWWSFTDLQRRQQLPDIPSGKRVVTYFSSSDDEFAAIGESFRWEGWNDQLDAVKGLIDVVARLPDVHLIIRLHPHLLKKHPDDMARWLAASKANGVAQVVEPQSPVDSYALLDASDVVVTSGSTIGMEAVFWGKPSVLLGPSDYDLLGAVHIAKTRSRLKELLEAGDLEAVPDKALVYGYYRASFGEPYRYYEPTSFITGRFKGVDLQRLPPLPRLVNRLKERVLGWWRSSPSANTRRHGAVLR